MPQTPAHFACAAILFATPRYAERESATLSFARTRTRRPLSPTGPVPPVTSEALAYQRLARPRE